MDDLPDNDAFGAMCRDYHEHGEAFEIIERDDGFLEPTGGPDAYFTAPEEWPDRDHTALGWVDGEVLVVGCGPGRHAIELQRRGHDVTAIDVSPGALSVARDRGVEDARHCDVAEVDGLDGSYDTVTMLGRNFGLVGSESRAPAILDRLAAVTTDDATLVASSIDPLATDDPAHQAYHDRNRARGWLPGRMRMRVRYRQYTGEWLDYLQVGPERMGELVAETDWSVTDGAGTGAAYAARLNRAD